MSKLENTLIDINNRLDKFKGKKLLEECIKERLDKSLKAYVNSVNNAYNYLYDIAGPYALRRLNKKNKGGNL